MIYLIDFENVHEDGFHAIGRTGEKDIVYCFFTKNVARISMAALAGLRGGQVHFIEADTGKQSLDLALVSFLGYLIGTRQDEHEYEILSNDNGFQKAADFWNKHRTDIHVRIRKTTQAETKGRAAVTGKKTAAASVAAVPETKPVSSPAQTQENAAEESQTARTASRGKASSRSRNRQKQAEQKASAKQPVPGPDARPKQEPLENTASKPAGADNAPEKSTEKTASSAETAAAPKTESRKETKPAESKKNPAKSETVKPEAAKQKAERPEAPETEAPKHETPKSSAVSEESFEPDPATITALEAVGIDAETGRFLLNETFRNRKEKNVRQLVYRSLVKKYGQRDGLRIYNAAKKAQL